MPAIEPLCNLIGIKSSILTKEEGIFLEAELFWLICEELKDAFRKQHHDYFILMKFNIETENSMLDAYFLRLIIKDILSTDEYTIEGIARYTNTHEDIVQEVFIGKNMNPSAIFLRRLIELHRSIRQSFYLALMKKITSKYLTI